MTFKKGRRIFFQLPFGNSARRTYGFEPFVSQPPRGATVAGIVDHKRLVAVGRNAGLVPDIFYRFNPVQNPFSGRPQFNLIDQPKEFNTLSVVSLGRFFDFIRGWHGFSFPGARLFIPQ